MGNPPHDTNLPTIYRFDDLNNLPRQAIEAKWAVHLWEISSFAVFPSALTEQHFVLYRQDRYPTYDSDAYTIR